MSELGQNRQCRLRPSWGRFSVISGLPAQPGSRGARDREVIAAETWHLMVISAFPKYRGNGLRTAMLRKAEDLALAMLQFKI
jgi:hypothetical protein